MLHTNIKQMLADERGVSPVIGVILMVAVTVVLAALIGAFVFGLGDDLGASAPNAQVDFSFDQTGENDDVLTVTHDGGQSITDENTGALFISGDSDDLEYEWAEDPDNDGNEFNIDESFSAGSEIVEITDTERSAEPSQLELQWEAPDGDQTATLGEWTRP